MFSYGPTREPLSALPALLALALNGLSLGSECSYHFRMSESLCDILTRTRESRFGVSIELGDRVGLERVAHDFTPFSVACVA